MNQDEKVRTVRAMLYPISSPPNVQNQLFEFKINRSLDQNEEYHRTTYSIRGQRVCIDLFAAVVQLSLATVHRHARQVSSTPVFEYYISNRRTNRKGKLGVQSIITIAFLKRFAELYGFPCLRNRGTEKTCGDLILMPSDITKEEVYNKYRTKWKDLLDNAMQHYEITQTEPAKPFSYNSFCKMWQEHFSNFKIMAKGFDFCDTCIHLREKINNTDDGPEKLSFQNDMDEHRSNAQHMYTVVLKVTGQTKKRAMRFFQCCIIQF